MFKFVGGDVWKNINAIAKTSRKKKAALAYVTKDSDIKFGEGDLLFVDASNQAIASGETSAEVIGRAVRVGANVYSCPGLHAKAMLFDDTAVVGSANLSQSSADDLIEGVVITDNPQMVASVAEFFESLKGASDKVDTAFIKRIKQIEVVRRGHGSKKRRAVHTRRSSPNVWILGTSDLADDAYPAERKRAEKGAELAEQEKKKSSSTVTWARITGKSRFRREAKPGDVIININSEHGKKTPYAVYKTLPILRVQKESTCTRFYMEYFANSDKTALTWGQLKNLVKRVKLPRKVTRFCAQEVPTNYADAIFALWDEAIK
jgi:hypothetical protein